MADNDLRRGGYRARDDDRRGGDWGYPRDRDDERGSGGRGAWYGAGNGDYRPDSDRDWGGERSRDRYRDRPFGASDAYGRMRREEDDYDYRGRERDYGDSAGYGTGGSALDWRDVMGDDRRGRDRGGSRGSRREPGFTDLAFGHGFGSGYEGRDYSGEGRERDRGSWRGRDDDRGRDRDERGLLERAGDEIASWFGADTSDRPGRHRGRGPKGYQRSDERIRDDVSDRLTDDPHIDASDIEVTVQNREVTLSGMVQSRFEKRHAEDIAESVSGVAHVQNNLRVGQGAGTDTGLLSGGGTMGGLAGAGGTNV